MWGKTLILVNDSRYAHKKHSVFKYYGIIFICGVQCLWIIKILLVCWDVITWVMNYVITWVMNYVITLVMNLCGKGNPRNPWTLIPLEQWWFHSTSAGGIDRDIHFTLFVWPEAWKKRTTRAQSVCWKCWKARAYSSVKMAARIAYIITASQFVSPIFELKTKWIFEGIRLQASL